MFLRAKISCEEKNKILSFKALFPRKSSLKICRVCLISTYFELKKQRVICRRLLYGANYGKKLE